MTVVDHIRVVFGHRPAASDLRNMRVCSVIVPARTSLSTTALVGRLADGTAAVQTPQINSYLFAMHVAKKVLTNRRGWYEAGKIHEALSADMLRSKSELIIANLLHERDIPFRYEQPLFAGDGTLRLPDFTITWRGVTHYWEHLGLHPQHCVVISNKLSRACAFARLIRFVPNTDQMSTVAVSKEPVAMHANSRRKHRVNAAIAI